MPHENTSDCPTEKEQLRRLKEIVGASLQTRSQRCLARRGLYSREGRIFEGMPFSFLPSFLPSFFLSFLDVSQRGRKRIESIPTHVSAEIRGAKSARPRRTQPSRIHRRSMATKSRYPHFTRRCVEEKGEEERGCRSTAKGDGRALLLGRRQAAQLPR